MTAFDLLLNLATTLIGIIYIRWFRSRYRYKSGLYCISNKYVISTYDHWLTENCEGAFKIKKHELRVMGGSLLLACCSVHFSLKRDLDHFVLNWGNGE